jgi:hypothetical protein
LKRETAGHGFEGLGIGLRAARALISYIAQQSGATTQKIRISFS